MKSDLRNNDEVVIPLSQGRNRSLLPYNKHSSDFLHNAKAYVGRNLLKFIFMEDTIMKRKILTINEAAQLIDGLTEYRIRQMCISGQLPCFMAGKKYLIAEENLYRAVFGENYERKDGDVA